MDSSSTPTPESVLARLLEIIANARWVFAITYAKTAPHEYCLREDLKKGNVPKEDIVFFAECIRDYGYKEMYYTYQQTYLDIDGYKYWVMDPLPEDVELVNRAPLDQEIINKWKNGGYQG